MQTLRDVLTVDRLEAAGDRVTVERVRRYAAEGRVERRSALIANIT